MAAELTVRWWRANEPKLVKHMEWGEGCLESRALGSWESSKKNVEAGTGDLEFFYKKLLEWGEHLKTVLQVKHDWLNRVTHAESRKKIEELMGILGREMAGYQVHAKALEGVKAQQLKAVGTPNTGRPLPKRPPPANAK